MSKDELEKLVEELNDPALLQEYKKPYDDYRPSVLPRMLGGILVFFGNLVYGKKPSYQKFRAVEVIARIPYHSWASAAFTLLTMHYADEAQALKLSTIMKFSRFASDNETMHVVVISGLARTHHRSGVFRYTIIPVLFSFFYFWVSYVLYMINPKWSLEINYLFEQHSFEQYSLFLEQNEVLLKSRAISSEFLAWYGRNPRSEYEFFMSVRNDELIHRNRSIHEIEFNRKHGKV